MIRTFRFGDSVLIQQLGRQATKLNTVEALLQPHSALWTSLSAMIPWDEAKVTTYVLRQQGHDLVGLGYLQVQKRPGRPELDIISLAPGLDSPRGHPAIWEKLLSHHNAVASQQQIARIFVDVPDQPLPVHTFTHVGFRTYTRQTIWRLTALRPGAPTPEPVSLPGARVRSMSRQDEWALLQLYAATVPEAVRQAEGQLEPSGEQTLKPPILEWWQGGACQCYVLEEAGELTGAVQVAQGKRGVWLQLWADLLDPAGTAARHLLRHALDVVRRTPHAQPVYVGVNDYHGALGVLLEELGFAPFTDRAKMVKQVPQWVREPALEPVHQREPARQVAIARFKAPAVDAPPLRNRTLAHQGDGEQSSG